MNDYKATGTPPMIGACLTIEDWKSHIGDYSWGKLRPTRLVLHHTYRPSSDQWRGLRSMRGMQHFYAGKGWSAAPHVYAAPDGIWLFTPLRDVGVHAGTGNGSYQAGWYSIGLEMVGDFDEQRPSGAVWDNALAVMGGLSIALNIPPAQLISFHRDYTNQKSCPGHAVSKEWVWAEVERWIAAQPDAQPPFTANPAGLAEELRALTYKQRGGGYHADWAFHQNAIARGLGAPTDITRRAMSGTSALNYQAFGRDVLFCVVPQWSAVQSLAQTLAAQPNHTIAQAVRAAVFHDQGIALDAKDPLLAAAIDMRAGPPIGGLRTTKIGSQRGRLLVCAADTLFLPDGANAVVRLSPSAGTEAAALIAATFEALGVAQPPASPFAAAASSPWQGAPLGPIQTLNYQGHIYTAQVYALDTFVADRQGTVQRLSTLGGAPQHKGLDESAPGMVEQIHVAAVHGDAAMLVDAGRQHDLTGAHLLITRHGYVLPVPRARMNAQATTPTTLLVLVDQEKDGAPLSEMQASALNRLLQAFEHRYQLPRTAVRLS